MFIHYSTAGLVSLLKHCMYGEILESTVDIVLVKPFVFQITGMHIWSHKQLMITIYIYTSWKTPVLRVMSFGPFPLIYLPLQLNKKNNKILSEYVAYWISSILQEQECFLLFYNTEHPNQLLHATFMTVSLSKRFHEGGLFFYTNVSHLT